MSAHLPIPKNITEEGETLLAEHNLWFFVLERLLRDLVSLAIDDPMRVQAARDVINLRDHIRDFILPASGISDGGAQKVWRALREKAYETLDGRDCRSISMRGPIRHQKASRLRKRKV